MSERFTAKCHLLGADIDTDIIIPTEYLALKSVEEMKPYAFSPLGTGLAQRLEPGDVIVAGPNFGCGSSREQAPEVIKALGVRAVIAGSFARIFYRNAINNGLLLIECPGLSEAVAEGDEITVEPGREIVAAGRSWPIGALPENLLEILRAGGLVAAMRRRNGLD